MMLVYAEQEAYEQIALYPGRYPNWRGVLTDHARVCINLTKAQLDEQLVPEEILFEYVNQLGGKAPVALKEYFDALYDDPSEMMTHPRAAFLLKHNKKEAAILTDTYGLVVQAAKELDDSVLVSPAMFKDLPKGKVIEDKSKLGWNLLLDIDRPPSNAMVVIDPYVLTSSNGLFNLTRLCDVILPQTLQVVYQVAIICSHVNTSGPKTEAWRSQQAGKIITAIRTLRKYEMEVEVVFEETEDYHRRRMVLNYANLQCDKGFAVFKASDGKTVASLNDASFKRVFHDPSTVGDSQFSSASKDLETVNRRTEKLAEHINKKTALDLGSIMGDCKPNKTLKNRLVNDV